MSWKIAEGEELSRAEIHRRCRGQTGRGICISNESSAVLLFSTIKGRKFYGFDRPLEDGGYLYTGEGVEGDQTFSGNNVAVRDHRLKSRTLRLFDEIRLGKHRYLGEYVLDELDPFRYEEAPDVKEELRQVIVFHLRRASGTRRYDNVRPKVEVSIEDVELEAHNVDRFRVNPAKPVTEAERRESLLVQRYAAWLDEQGHESKQRRIKPSDHAHSLKTDLFDLTANELVEAKGSVSRTYIRTAIGQILDYGRYAKARRRAILLPSRPAQDMIDLLRALGISCIFEESGSFRRIEAAPSFCQTCPLTEQDKYLS
jgi:hypothetical protein